MNKTLIRAAIIGFAAGILGLGWRGYVFGAAVVAAFALTDWIAEDDAKARTAHLAARVARTLGSLRDPA